MKKKVLQVLTIILAISALGSISGDNPSFGIILIVITGFLGWKVFIEKEKVLTSPKDENNSNYINESEKYKSPLQTKYRKKHVFINKYVVLDFETTGLSAVEDEIIEIGAVLFENGEPIANYNQLVKPNISISSFITKHTGITNEMVADTPAIHEVIEQLVDFIGSEVIVAHNASFDMKFLFNAIAKSGIFHEVTNQVTDTLSASRKYFPRLHNHKLPTLKKELKLEYLDSHRAIDDCIVTGKVYWACKKIKETTDSIKNENKLN